MQYRNHLPVFNKLAAAVILSWSVTACTNTSLTADGLSGELTEELKTITAPEQWYGASSSIAQAIAASSTLQAWLTSFNDQHLLDLVNQAFARNYQLSQLSYAAEIKKIQLLNAGTQLWPDLSINLAESRRRAGGSGNVTSDANVELKLHYELDVWGKLSANEQQANLAWLAQQANLEQAQQQLAANVASAWYATVAAQQLWQLALQRAENSEQNLTIIESGYQQGLNAALDVYLARNELNTALSNVAKQHDNLLLHNRTLGSLLAVYPSDEFELSSQQLPMITDSIPAGTPLDMIKRKPEIRASWYQLLAQDAALALAHKQRFPSFNFSASLANNQSSFIELFSSTNLAWSLLGSLSAPLFQAGRLKNNEQIARLTLKQTEQQYLQTLHQAVTQVENALTSETSLQQRVVLQQKAKENAQAAYKLAFEQYQLGLAIYTTVLDAQNRWFDAQSNLLQLQGQLIDNRIALFVALGGDFSN
jgi:outer membrane protein, multidrug efflux system